MHPKLDWPEHPRSKFEKKWLMRHVAAKTSKRIQKSSFFVGKRTHIRVILCLCKGCKRMPVVTVMTSGLHALLMATAAMKNQTDRFYTTAIVFAGRSVYTTLFEPPLPP